MSLEQAATALFNMANDNGGDHNISVSLAQVRLGQ